MRRLNAFASKFAKEYAPQLSADQVKQAVMVDVSTNPATIGGGAGGQDKYKPTEVGKWSRRCQGQS